MVEPDPKGVVDVALAQRTDLQHPMMGRKIFGNFF
jgi:hypothetical protein